MKWLFLFTLAMSFVASSFAQRNIVSSQEITSIQVIGNNIFLSANHPQSGVELHVSDGTPGNLRLLKDINPGYAGSSPSQFTVFNDLLFFVAHSPVYGESLWKSDGTPQGTQLVYSSTGAHPRQLTVFKGLLYFTTNTGAIMRTDGTAEGTEIYYQSPFTWSRILRMVTNDNYIYFTHDGRTIYRDDGSVRIDFLGPLSWEDVYFRHMFVLEGKLMVIKASSYNSAIRVYTLDETEIDDDPEGQWPLILKLDAPLYGRQEIDNFTLVNGKLFFTFRKYYDNIPPADELWISDGSVAGTMMIKSFGWYPHFSRSDMRMLFPFKGRLYFRAGDAAQRALWTSDGTQDGTVKFHNVVLTDLYNDERIPVFVGEDYFYFCGDENSRGAELWISDGTANGTMQLLDIEDNGGSFPRNIIASDGIVYFVTSKQFQATLWSSVPAPDISVTGLWGNPISSGATPHLINTISAGECAEVDLTIHNKGLKELFLEKIIISGADFYLRDETLPERIGPGGLATIRVVANPIAAGPARSVLTIYSNDRDESKYVINLNVNASPSNNDAICDFAKRDHVKSLIPAESTRTIHLSHSSVAEGLPSGTTIGQFALQGITTDVSYAFITGDGDEDNAYFTIEKNELRSSIVFSLNLRTLYTIRVKADYGNGETEASFRIVVTNISFEDGAGMCRKTFEKMSFSYHSIEANSAGHLFITTNQGKILRSTDNGNLWEVVYSAAYGSITDIIFKGNTGYAYGTKLLKSDNGGATWFELYVPFSEDYYWSSLALYFFDESMGYVGTAKGEIFFTTDGGRTWNIRSKSWHEFRTLFFLTPEKGYAVASWGDLVLTEDGGRTWETVDLSSLGWSSNVRDIWFVDKDKGFLSKGDDFYSTTNGGQSWVKNLTVYAYGSRRIKFYGDKTGFLYGGHSGGYIYKTTNGGTTWHEMLPGMAPGNVTGLAQSATKIFIVNNTPYFGSAEGARSLGVSSDGGATWEALHYSSDRDVYGIEFLSSGKGFTFGEAGFFKTQDNGLTWTIAQTGLPVVHDAKFLDENTVIFLSEGNLFKSTDGGITVRNVLTTPQSETYLPAGKLYLGPGNVMFSTSWQASYRSEDFGETWVLSLPNPDWNIQGLHFVTPQVGYRIELFGSVEKTTDGGKSWSAVFSAEPGAYDPFRSIFFLDESIGYSGGDYLRRTTDGGVTWERIDWPFYEIMRIHFTTEQQGYVVERGGRVWETSNGGASWRTLFSSSRIFDVQFNNDEIYLAGENGLMARMNTTPAAPSLPGYIFGPDRVCVGDAVEYKLSVSGNVQTYWNSNARILEDHSGSISVQFSEPGEYTITARHFNSCGSTASRATTIQVSAPPATPIIDGPNPVAPGKRNAPYYVSNGGDELNRLFWEVIGSSAVTTTDKSVLVNWAETAVQGKINVLAVDNYGCRANGSLVIEMDITLAVETDPALHIALYPNPTEDDFTILSGYEGILSIRVLDGVGRVHDQLVLTGGEEVKVPTRHLPAGLYLIEVFDGKYKSAKKLIKK